MNDLSSTIRALAEGCRNWVSNTANAAAVIFGAMPDINWAGFYVLRGDELVLGPFQGKPACLRISINRGVCGAAARERQTIVVDNVHEFPGHIACDSASNSEIVVPIIQSGRLAGVLDVDSATFARFTPEDKLELEKCAAVIADSCDF